MRELPAPDCEVVAGPINWPNLLRHLNLDSAITARGISKKIRLRPQKLNWQVGIELA